MLGHVTEWFYHDLAGIQSAGPGFKQIRFKPAPVAGLDWVKASYASVRGKIVSEWRQEHGRFVLKVVVPPNTTATVHLPGSAAQAPAGAQQIGAADGRTIFRVGSGEYEFTSAL
jgi:hypothetical protein